MPSTMTEVELADTNSLIATTLTEVEQAYSSWKKDEGSILKKLIVYNRGLCLGLGWPGGPFTASLSCIAVAP